MLNKFQFCYTLSLNGLSLHYNDCSIVRGAGGTGAAGAAAPGALIVRGHAEATGCPFS